MVISFCQPKRPVSLVLPPSLFFPPFNPKKMWTFLGIASFTYLYKKSNTVLTFAHKELLMAGALFLTVGLLLSYVRYFHGQKLRVSQVFHLPLSLLSFVPVINHFIPQTSTQRSEKVETSCTKVRRFMETCRLNYVNKGGQRQIKSFM